MTDVELLTLVLRATQAGKIEWKRSSGNCIEARMGDAMYFIDSQCPVLADGSSWDVALFMVLVDGILLTFADGTEQSHIVTEIIAAAFEEMAGLVAVIEEERARVGERLRALLDGE